MSNAMYDRLRLENQLCFPLYACSREIIKQYKPFLDELDLTYTQYITMMVLWEQNEIKIKDLGAKLFLDSGTLTPVVNALEKKGLAVRRRSETDRRDVYVRITDAGLALREQAATIPPRLGACMPISPEDAADLYRILRGMMTKLGKEC